MNERCKQIYTKSGLIVDKNLGIYFEQGTYKLKDPSQFSLNLSADHFFGLFLMY